MDRDDYYSQENRNERALEKTRENFRDLQNELAGRETGRAYRFTSDEERERRTGRANARQSERTHTQLQLLLSQPDYARDHNRVMKMLIEVEQRTQLAIDTTELGLSQNDQELDDIQSRASALPDGTRVYRDKEGNVFTEDGEQVLPPDRDSIVWRDDNPGYEDYLRNRERDITLRDYLDRLRDYQINVLGHIRGRMTDPDNPVPKECFADFDKMITDGPEKPEALNQDRASPQNDTELSSNMAVPQF